MKNPAATLTAMRKTETIACERCGKPATGLKGQVRYCSKACKQAAYRKRQRWWAKQGKWMVGDE